MLKRSTLRWIRVGTVSVMILSLTLNSAGARGRLRCQSMVPPSCTVTCPPVGCPPCYVVTAMEYAGDYCPLVQDCCPSELITESLDNPSGCLDCPGTETTSAIEPMTQDLSHEFHSEVAPPEIDPVSPPINSVLPPQKAPETDGTALTPNAVEVPAINPADDVAPALSSEPPADTPSDEIPDPASAGAGIFGDPELSTDPDSESPPLPADSQDFPADQETPLQDDLGTEADSAKESLPAPDALESFDFGDPSTDAPSATPDEATPPAEDSAEDVLDGLGVGIAPPSNRGFVSVRERGLTRRYWSDESGRFHTTGQLVSISAENVRILKDNGRYSTVPVNRLSRLDRAYVRALETDLGHPSAAIASN
ncbi:MAG: SHD1 domain-containing protein [Planctomycetota bacterium]|nr:SHD1 domain-containing protein [Planctomycetota bacterium]MDA1177572.1 SHD1 domain-containing protein [Planctomycetota bacterium]